jgi:hypothetical protein
MLFRNENLSLPYARTPRDGAESNIADTTRHMHAHPLWECHSSRVAKMHEIRIHRDHGRIRGNHSGN